ncbi:hypothetical protein [Natronorubrum thiooxidans]|uniref:Uncharacterized protein n=1 Tax=Natronorubrum thiooxidans TaxID=308853 RepID=A0A1N7FIY4_9EURY|nr:hypothetical protein [Natronorubrum thiooxidans]SIS00271.1 hypothetical protein SAMN05421752_10724 [Natronorubrum thiooxidans]
MKRRTDLHSLGVAGVAGCLDSLDRESGDSRTILPPPDDRLPDAEQEGGLETAVEDLRVVIGVA